MWWHQTRPLQLSLVVDNFGVKYELQEGITHLPDALKTIQNIYEDWDENLYYGINLKWD